MHSDCGVQNTGRLVNHKDNIGQYNQIKIIPLSRPYRYQDHTAIEHTATTATTHIAATGS